MTTKSFLDGDSYAITLHNHHRYSDDVVINPNVRTMPRRKGLSTNKQKKQRAKAKRARKIH